MSPVFHQNRTPPLKVVARCPKLETLDMDALKQRRVKTAPLKMSCWFCFCWKIRLLIIKFFNVVPTISHDFRVNTCEISPICLRVVMRSTFPQVLRSSDCLRDDGPAAALLVRQLLRLGRRLWVCGGLACGSASWTTWKMGWLEICWKYYKVYYPSSKNSGSSP